MRKILFGLLLAGAAAPALAAGPRHNHDDDSSPRPQLHFERPSRDNDSERPQIERSAPVRPQFQRPEGQQDFQGPRERPQFQRPEGRPDFQRPQFGGGFGRPDRQVEAQRPQFDEGDDRSADVRPDRPGFRGNPYAQERARSDAEAARNWRQQDGVNWRQQRPGGYPDRDGYGRDARRNDGRYANGGLVVSGVPRPGTQPPLRFVGPHDRDRNRDRWNRDWRNDHRHDWRDYRRRHWNSFHLGFYYDPFGWQYQPYTVGWRLWPNYYQRNYWIEAGMYGLPYPPPGMQWVRYWNDALLVDLYTGEVVDVIQGFFW